MNEVSKIKVTSLAELAEYSKGVIVELPEFAEGQPFVVRMTRPSMMKMMEEGKIPNELLTTAEALFTGDTTRALNVETGKLISNMREVMEVIAEASLAEPKYHEIKEAGVELTDQQLLAIFNYNQEGVNSLKSFRRKQENYRSRTNGENVQKTSKRNNAHNK